jgi:ATP-dependent RNA helicase RhlE
MLVMVYLSALRKVLSHLPRQRQTLLFSATLPPAIAQLAREMLRDPVTLNIERQAAPATGITHAAYPVAQTHKSPLLLHLLQTGDIQSVVVFTRTKHRANRLADYLVKNGVSCARIHGNRSQAQRTEALAGFKRGQYRVLVATDIAARGIDVEALSHVVNFDVPNVADDYIHRVGRTARAEATGDAFTFVSPEEEGDLRAIEKALGKRIPRTAATGFDAKAVQAERPETPLAERIAEIRARKAEERARAAAKAAALAAGQPAGRTGGARPAGGRPAGPPRGGQNRGFGRGGGRGAGTGSAPGGNRSAGAPSFRPVRGS